MEQALADLNAGNKNIEIKIYHLSVQCSYQAVEKALKALFIRQFNKIPEKHFDALYELNPEWIPSRYPDAAISTPFRDYDESSAKLHFRKAKEVVLWVKKQIQK